MTAINNDRCYDTVEVDNGVVKYCLGKLTEILPANRADLSHENLYFSTT